MRERGTDGIYDAAIVELERNYGAITIKVQDKLSKYIKQCDALGIDLQNSDIVYSILRQIKLNTLTYGEKDKELRNLYDHLTTVAGIAPDKSIEDLYNKICKKYLKVSFGVVMGLKDGLRIEDALREVSALVHKHDKAKNLPLNALGLYIPLAIEVKENKTGFIGRMFGGRTQTTAATRDALPAELPIVDSRPIVTATEVPPQDVKTPTTAATTTLNHEQKWARRVPQPKQAPEPRKATPKQIAAMESQKEADNRPLVPSTAVREASSGESVVAPKKVPEHNPN